MRESGRASDDFVLLRTRLEERILRQPVDIDEAKEWSAQLSLDGSWPDIDYASRAAANFPGEQHWRRLSAILLACKEGAFDVSKEEVSGQIRKALAYWFGNSFSSTNWWWTQIGIPLAALEVAFLMGDDYTDFRGEFCALLDNSPIGMTGQNLNWLSTINLQRGVLEEDEERIRQAANALHDAVTITTGEGIQPDFSFHQHGSCLYSFGYGRGLLVDAVKNAHLLRGTSFAYSTGKVAILSGLLLDGTSLMVRNHIPDLGTRGREITRGPDTDHVFVKVAEMLIQLQTDRKEELNALIDRLTGTQPPLMSLNRMFWRSDFMVHHRPAFYASARGHSILTVKTDMPYNHEGLFNHHMSDGACFVMRDGEEHHTIIPVWDWQMIPGTTVVQDGDLAKDKVWHLGESPLLGGVSTGQTGCMGFLLERQGLLAHKSWFFLDDRIVCLGAGIATTAENSVYTTLEQCLQRGECPAEGEVCKLEDGRFWHDGMGWVVHDGPVLNEWHGMVEGSWYRANNNLSRDSIEKPVLRLWLDHGKAPADEGYAYTIFPECEKQQLYGENINTEVEILQNSPSCQAVYDASKGAVYAIFYSAGELHLPNQKNLRAGAPAVAIVEMGKSAIRATPLDRRVHQVEVALEG